MKYYIANNGRQTGPFELHELLANGLSANSYVWCETMPNWLPATQVPEVAALLRQAPPASSDFASTIPNPDKELGMTDALKICFSKYVDFKGRARRSEYWWFQLWQLIFLIPTCCLSGVVFFLPSAASTVRRLHDTGHSGWWWGVGMVWYALLQAYSVYLQFTIGHANFYYQMIASAPLLVSHILYFIYQIVILVFCVQDSQLGDNKYGPNPKY